MCRGDGPPAAGAGCLPRGSRTPMGEGFFMSGTFRARSTRHSRHRWWRAFHRTAAVSAMLFVIAELGAVALSAVRTAGASAAPAPPGQGFTVTPGDLHFILKQIQIS